MFHASADTIHGIRKGVEITLPLCLFVAVTSSVPDARTRSPRVSDTSYLRRPMFVSIDSDSNNDYFKFGRTRIFDDRTWDVL